MYRCFSFSAWIQFRRPSSSRSLVRSRDFDSSRRSQRYDVNGMKKMAVRRRVRERLQATKSEEEI
jgi:hypothetical protein